MSCKHVWKKLYITTTVLSLFLSVNIIQAEMSPQEVVIRYYTADLEGARLSGHTYKAKITPLITWKHEPGWDTLFVTKKVYVSKIRKDTSDKASIEVRYKNVGILGGGLGGHADLLEIEFTDVISFILVKHGTEWKIQDPIFYPHVSPRTLITHFEDFIAVAKGRDPDTVEKLKNLINRLKALDIGE